MSKLLQVGRRLRLSATARRDRAAPCRSPIPRGFGPGLTADSNHGIHAGFADTYPMNVGFGRAPWTIVQFGTPVFTGLDALGYQSVAFTRDVSTRVAVNDHDLQVPVPRKSLNRTDVASREITSAWVMAA